MGFQIVQSSVLKVFKVSIKELADLADHYYLAEAQNLYNSVGWGSRGLELRGTVRINSQQIERIENFMLAAKYDIAVNNCEHFANYVLHGINLSSQQYIWWKYLGSETIRLLQPVQSVNQNLSSYMNQQIAEVLAANLKQAKIEKADRQRIEFWKFRGVDVN